MTTLRVFRAAPLVLAGMTGVVIASGVGCGEQKLLCNDPDAGTTCPAVGGNNWSLVTDSVNVTGSCSTMVSGTGTTPLSIIQDPAGADVSVTVQETYLISSVPTNESISATGSIFADDSMSATTRQPEQFLFVTTQINESDNLHFQFSNGSSFTGTWNATVTQTTTGGSTPKSVTCTKSAVVHGAR